MKLEDLFIGAWVYNDHHKKNIQITPYDFFTHRHDENGVQHLQHNSIPRSGMDLHPIPLTPEILEKNGFTHYGESWYISDSPANETIMVSFLMYNTVIDVKRGHNNFCREIPHGYRSTIKQYLYVHELQAAMKLFGIEKEIVL